MPGLQAVLWDMDGTLVDSEKVWAEVQLELLASLGASWTLDDCMTLIGSDLRDAVQVWMTRIPAGVISAEELADRMFSEVVVALRREVTFQPGALELLQALRKEEVPCALVSASYRSMIDAVLGHLPPNPFDVIVAGDEVTLGKPHPEPYLTGAAKLGVDPANCIVIEDSVTGTEAGTAAGMYVVAVPQWVTIPDAPRRLVVKSLEPLTPESLRALLR
ncbi:HAD family phosphatase [Kribbella solani]|uniref:HAD superfamily hydrolase (TIGR01509 family) n=1 Tax=Kribbella solani TaxID=236067 RepID=A0A841DNK2_9ACTN|nr:HAD family phosphatase [Kribbella solani]MBB5977977.1 HAD superfamily hydrolase (TIGR01509 family) [Kribbella solani]MDX2971999.1 HAD family phosphatase [Kribbella solani]MDX3006221.1 HAD family phosphatase [Kribbella solani]